MSGAFGFLFGAAAFGTLIAVGVHSREKSIPVPPPPPPPPPKTTGTMKLKVEPYVPGVSFEIWTSVEHLPEAAGSFGEAIYPAEFEIDPGNYVLIFTKSGFEPKSQNFSIQAGELVDIHTGEFTPIIVKVWLTWQDELIKKMDTSLAPTDIVKNLYQRMLEDTSLAIWGMTESEQELFNQDFYGYLINIGISYGSIPSTLIGKLQWWGYDPAHILFVLSGMRVTA